MTDPPAAVREMRRVTRPAAVALDPEVRRRGDRLDSDECADLLQSFIAAPPEEWDEDIGE